MITTLNGNLVDAAYLMVRASPRYWEDAMVNGIQDDNGDLIPCRIKDNWCPTIDIETGLIINWEKSGLGPSAKVHYKICDIGTYILLDKEMDVIARSNSHVPKMLQGGEGDSDYIIMNIDFDGQIQGWEIDNSSFNEWSAA